MKKKTVLAAVAALLVSSTAMAEPTEQQILGALAGGALGNTIGDGDGRKAATVLGAILGYRNGERIFAKQNDRRDYVNETVYIVRCREHLYRDDYGIVRSDVLCSKEQVR